MLTKEKSRVFQPNYVDRYADVFRQLGYTVVPDFHSVIEETAPRAGVGIAPFARYGAVLVYNGHRYSHRAQSGAYDTRAEHVVKIGHCGEFQFFQLTDHTVETHEQATESIFSEPKAGKRTNSGNGPNAIRH